MINQIYNFRLIACITLSLIFIGCKNELSKNKDIQTVNKKVTLEKLEQKVKTTFITTIKNEEYKLDIETKVSNDTLNIIDYKEDVNSSPIILNQKLSFFNANKLIIDHKPNIIFINKKTIKNQTLNVFQTPLYKVCLDKTKKFYIVFGSDYCNGSDCPEFIGIYSMFGKIIYEGVSNTIKKPSLKDVLKKHNIELNNPSQSIRIDEF